MRKANSMIVTGILALSLAGSLAAAPAFAAETAKAPPSPAATSAPAAKAASAPATDTKTATGAPHHAALSRQRIENIQQALNKSGAAITVDGVWGTKTEGALKQFQQQHSLKVTGQLDRATMKQLGAKTSA